MWKLPRLLLIFCQAVPRIVTLLFTGIALNVAQVLGFDFTLLCYFSGINLSSWIASLPTSLTFFRGTELKLISGREVMGLSFFFILVGCLIAMLLISVVFVFFDRRAMAFWAPGIDLSNIKGWL